MTFDVHAGFSRADEAAGPSTGGRHRARPSRPRGEPEWPEWAAHQLMEAASVAERVGGDGHLVLATELYRRWFNPVVGPGAPIGRPLAGVYRTAHAGSASRVTRDGMTVVDRNDVVGRDGWWRTWNDGWLPTRSRSGGVRVLLSPRPERVAEFVRTVTRLMRATTSPWLLACSTDPARLARTAAATLYLQTSAELPPALLTKLGACLRPVTPPLSLPMVPGAGLAQTPGNGMSFGEHRCHLVALALNTAEARHDPLTAVADVFRAHDVDPAHPYRT